MKYEEDDRSDTEEEKPVVVVLKAGDLTAEEVERIQNEGTTTETQNGKLIHTRTAFITRFVIAWF